MRLNDLDIIDLPTTRLAEYAAVPIAFTVTERLAIAPKVDADHVALLGRAIKQPYEKDYDRIATPPTDWPTAFDLSRWGLLGAAKAGVFCGCAAVAPAMDVMRFESLPPECAILWDLRVAPASRGRGIGAALFRAAAQWGHKHGYANLVAETQDTNVGACRFYAAMGCRLRSFTPDAYADVPGEARLLWQIPTHAQAAVRTR